MKIQERFNKVYSLILESKNSLTKELEEKIANDKFYFHSGTVLDSKVAYKTYKQREEIQRKVSKSEDVIGYDRLLNKLGNINEGELCVFTIVCKNATYIVFTTVDIDNYLGILKSNSTNYNKADQLNSLYKKMKLDRTSFVFVDKKLRK